MGRISLNKKNVHISIRTDEETKEHIHTVADQHNKISAGALLIKTFLDKYPKEKEDGTKESE